jgi:phosphatidylserine/phosphatidylglycerophosphate/cardiolipin synthase-like enzyme
MMDESATQGEGDSPSVWRFAHATRAHLIVDAADYFEIARDAMCSARQSIFLIGWDFDTRIRLAGGRRWWNVPRRRRFPARLGAFAVWLVRRTPRLRFQVLVWNFGAIKFFLRGTMIVDLLRWRKYRRIAVRLDSAHPVGCSHHQKIMTIDDRVAACGGIDMTGDRWDTPEHRDNDPRRHRPGGRRYGPWHDVTMLMEGDAAGALAELGRERWRGACGEVLQPCRPQAESPWPDLVEAEFKNVEIGISRTRAAWGSSPEVREIEALFVEQIARARRFVYAESQYFASRRIAEAIALRLAEPDPPEFLLINPQSAHGWLEQTAMDGARVRLLHAVLAHDHARRFHMFMPYTAAGAPIYVHAKLAIIDDLILRVGSANMNNRSMGLDSECDVFIDASRPANAHVGPAIERIRHKLLAEHCGLEPDQVGSMIERAGSVAAMIDAAPTDGKRLIRFELRPLSEAEKALADSTLLDPERPAELFEPISKRGLFRRGGFLRRPA